METLNGIIIFGAGNAGKRLARKLKKKQKICFFVDDDVKKIGKKIFKTPIISFNELISLSKKKFIKDIIVAIPSLNFDKRKKIFEKLFSIADVVTTLPFNSELIQDRIQISDLKKIGFEDLISRKLIKTNFKSLHFYNRKNILVTGSAGSIGSELCNQLSILKISKLVMLDHSESSLSNYIFKNKFLQKDKRFKFILGDISDDFLIKKILKKFKIDLIFHAAAYKHVDLLEDNIIASIKNNILGTKNILDQINICNKKIKFIYVSTDKAVSPISFLGYTKAFGEIISEIYLKKYKNDISIVRFGNVFASDGSVFNKFIEQIKSKKKVTLTNIKMKRYFMSIKEACHLLLKCPIIKSQNQVFILNMGKQIKIIDIIRKISKIYRNEIKFKIIGLRKGEKLKEKLSYNKLIKTKDKNIFLTKNPTIKKLDYIIDFVNKMKNNYKTNSEKKIKYEFKNFFKNYERNKIS